MQDGKLDQVWIRYRAVWRVFGKSGILWPPRHYNAWRYTICKEVLKVMILCYSLAGCASPRINRMFSFGLDSR